MEKRQNITPDVVEQTAKMPMTKINKAFNPKNYLNIKLEDGQMEKTLKIRLITIDKNSNAPFKHIKMHNVKVPKEVAPSGFKSYICLEKTESEFSKTVGHSCPFCEMNKKAWDKYKNCTDEAMKKMYKDISIANIANDVGILRCIERGHEEDGPKFWKYNIRLDNLDPEGQMRALYTTRMNESIEEAKEENDGNLPNGFVPDNIFDLDEGKDFLITITRALDKEGKPTDKTSIKITDYGKKKPLTRDEAQYDAWLNDNKVWSDVFPAKSYEYLKVILEGGIPWFDKENNVWSSKEELFNKEGDKKNISEKEREDNSNIKEAEKKVINQSNQAISDDDDDELPY